MASIDYPFSFAAHKDIITEQLPGFYICDYEPYYILYKNILLYEMQGDCGCIYMADTYYLTDKIYKDIENFAALNGYTKILCTLSEEYAVTETKDLLEKNGFTIIETGFSNRSADTNNDGELIYNFQTWLCFKVITPLIKGYV
ncbi:MAG: hypothetical protein ACP5N7_00760 [Candidatus Pacearchaeota archaeon]